VGRFTVVGKLLRVAGLAEVVGGGRGVVIR